MTKDAVKNTIKNADSEKKIAVAVELNMKNEFISIVSEILLQYHGSK